MNSRSAQALRLALCALVLECGQSANTKGKPVPDAGLQLRVPEAATNECDGATAELGDAGVDPECGASLPMVSFARDVIQTRILAGKAATCGCG